MISLNIFRSTEGDRRVIAVFTGARMPDREDFRILLHHAENARNLARLLDMLHVEWALEEHAVD